MVGEAADAFGEGNVGHEVGDMRSLIFGLRVFDPVDINDSNSSGLNIIELNKMTDKVVRLRNPDKDDENFEVNPVDLFNKDYLSTKEASKTTSLDPEVDEAAYQSWVEKIKEASQSLETSILDIGKSVDYSESERQKREARQKKVEEQRLAKEEKRLAKWEALGYTSLAVKEPISRMDSDIMSNSGCVQYVYGDCTKPSELCPSEPTIIFRYFFRHI